LHVYAGIGHGFGMRDRNKGAVAGWAARFREWLEAAGFLKR
jgi:endo-1,4-beta-xylanase